MYSNLKNMKNSILKFLLLAAVAMILLSSCKKEVIYPTDQLPANVPTIGDLGGVNRYGKFVLIGSRKLFKNNTYLVDGPVSSLRWGGSQLAIETLVKDSTNWSFYRNGKFGLNGDTTYTVISSANYTQILNDFNTHLNINGVTTNLADSIIEISVYGYSDNNNNEYDNILTFKKVTSW